MRNQGYIALMSAIIISVVLLGLAFTLSLRGFFGRFNVLETEQKEMGLGVAEGCAERAILKLATIPGYQGNESVMLRGQICQIYPILDTGSKYTIKTKVVVGQTVSNIMVEVSKIGFAVSAWQEIPTL